MGGINVGDVIVQLLFLGFIALIIVLLVVLFRSIKNRNSQLNRIEQKLDSLQEKEDDMTR